MNRLLPVAALLAFWPVWRWYGLRMTDGSDEPWGIAALIFGGWFLWRLRSEMRPTPGDLWAAGCLLLVYGIGYPVLPALLRAVVALSTLGFLSGTLGRRPAVWGLVTLSLPILASLQFYLGFPLRVATADMATGFLGVFGIDVAREGTQLVWQDQLIGVDAPCSGVKMLWTASFLAMTLNAIAGSGWIRTAVTCIASGGLALVANAVRTALLFAKEAAIVSLPDWMHEGIGLCVFGGLVLLLGRICAGHPDADRRAPVPPGNRSPGPRFETGAAVGLCLLVAGVPFLTPAPPATDATPAFPGWPSAWRGQGLEPLPMTEQEQAFARTFPGKIGVFTTGRETVIVRWVGRATRKLHSSADCLRAIGFQIEAQRPGHFLAYSPDGSVCRVKERIHEKDLTGSGRTWKEISAWFWSAALGSSEGPWWAVTVIQPVNG